MSEHPVLFSLLSSFDIFTIWTLILLIIGFSTLSRMSRGKSAAIVISLWLFTVVVKLGFAALGASRMKQT
jgi:FtsH-binding integral membrane protein